MTPTTSPLYDFIGDSVISEGTIKLAVTRGEPPQIAIAMINFLVVKCPSAFNEVLGKPLLKALKVVTLIHSLIMKFPIAAEVGQV